MISGQEQRAVSQHAEGARAQSPKTLRHTCRGQARSRYISVPPDLSTMTRLVAALIIFCWASSAALAEPDVWLMQGDVFTDEEAASRLLQPESHRMYYPVSTRAEIYYEARPGKVVTCVIAASVHLNGRVSVVEGGYGAKTARVRYTTKNGEPDVFFVLVQAAKRKPAVSVEGNVARAPQVDIVYEPMRNWTQEEVQNALRNVSSTFLSS